MKILLIGNGGREHALADALSRENTVWADQGGSVRRNVEGRHQGADAGRGCADRAR